jgi:ubiquinone/menaquinone biosynthesis C-methylase UbiE
MKTRTKNLPVSTNKTEKELAFLQDLFIAPDWGERFAELIDEHVALPKEGRVLYLASGTGGHALALHEKASGKLEFVCLDENHECVQLARAKAIAANDQLTFEAGKVDELAFPDNHFKLVVANASLLSSNRSNQLLSEMVRVTAPGGTVALALPTASSFGEFFSIYWEALHNSGLMDHETDIEHLIMEILTVSQIEQLAEQEGLDDVATWTRVEEFDYDSGEQFLNSPLVAEFLLRNWLASVPEESRVQVANEVSRIINEERHEAEFALSVKATLLIGRKTHSH